MIQRVVAALPFVIAAIGMGMVLAEYVSGEVRLTQKVRTVAAWPLYEMLAVFYASLLPLAMTVVGFLSALGACPGGGRGLVIAWLVLLLPLALLAWSWTPDVPGGGWMLVVFLVLAFARLLSHRAHNTMMHTGFLALMDCVKTGALRYGLGTAAFLLSAVFILPLEPIFGFEMPSVEHGQYYLMLGIGVVYFALNAIVELLPIKRIGKRMREAAEKHAQQAAEPAA